MFCEVTATREIHSAPAILIWRSILRWWRSTPRRLLNGSCRWLFSLRERSNNGTESRLSSCSFCRGDRTYLISIPGQSRDLAALQAEHAGNTHRRHGCITCRRLSLMNATCLDVYFRVPGAECVMADLENICYAVERR